MTVTLPTWPAEPAPVDPTGAAYLIVCIGSDPRAEGVTARWAAATQTAPTRILRLTTLAEKNDAASYLRVLSECRTGIRIMVSGGQYDVLTAMAMARRCGALPAELTGHAIDTIDLPVYCVHCRTTFRAETIPGECTPCPTCRRTLEVHCHYASAHGSYLASDSTAYDLD